MSREYSGNELNLIGTYVNKALLEYEDLTENRVKFNLYNAQELKTTPNEPYAAKSISAVKFEGDIIGDLVTIIFEPGDARADGPRIDQRLLPQGAKILPRSQKGIYGEVMLTLAQLSAGNPAAKPELLEGRLDLIGLDEGEVTKIGDLGHVSHLFALPKQRPCATFTVGTDENGERFGDPHAVYNSSAASVQIAGFLAITDAYSEYAPVFTALGATSPFKR